MADFFESNFDLLYAKEFEFLRTEVEQIKVMLWAGDYWSATNALTNIRSRHSELMERALEYETEMYKKRRLLKPELERELQDHNLNQTEFDYALKRQVAKQSQATSSEDASLFIIAPVARIIDKFEKRIEADTGVKDIFKWKTPKQLSYVSPIQEFADIHPPTGFHYIIFSSDSRTPKMKAYRFDFEEVSAPSVFDNLHQNLAIELDWLDQDIHSEMVWPLWVRAFLPNTLAEITAYDPGRIMVSFTTQPDTDVRDWVTQILNAFVLTPSE
jgi:hypothetical protein